MKKASVVDMKNRLSAYLDEVAGGAGPVVITKRGKPVAALGSMENFEALNRAPRNQGLINVVGKWEGFGKSKSTSCTHSSPDRSLISRIP